MWLYSLSLGRRTSQIVVLLLISAFVAQPLGLRSVFAQTAAEPSESRAVPFVLHDGTPVRLRTTRLLSSKDAKTGETVDFEVLEDVKVNGIVVIPRESFALGTVTQAKPNGRLGKGGKLDMTIDSVRIVSGEKVPLRAVKEIRGDNRTGTMTGALVASGLLFFPAAPIFLFIKGKNITIPKGTEFTAYVTGDVALDMAKFAAPQSTETAQAATLTISVRSNPDGADIEIDGKFIGNTPSAIPIKPGEYRVVVRKPGYEIWERTVTVPPGSSITLDALLERIP